MNAADPEAVAARVLAPDDPRWTRFVAGHPDALTFHHPAWMLTLAECYRFRPFVVAVEDAAGELTGGLPVMEVSGPLRRRRWSALPFTDRCPPLLASPVDEAPLAAALLAAADDAGVARVDVRAPLPGLDGAAVAVYHELDLTGGPDAVAKAFNGSARRGARKALRDGVVLRRGATESDLADVFFALQLRTRRRLGVPVQPRRLFQLLWRHVLAPGHGHLLLAYAGGEPIAGVVFLTAGGTVISKYGASDERAKKLRPNDALYAEAIVAAAADGYRSFDFGRSDFEDEGLRDFKSRWGAPEQPLVHAGLGGGAAAVERGAATRILSAVIRRSPEVVCRGLGETLYRAAA